MTSIIYLNALSTVYFCIRFKSVLAIKCKVVHSHYTRIERNFTKKQCEVIAKVVYLVFFRSTVNDRCIFVFEFCKNLAVYIRRHRGRVSLLESKTRTFRQIATPIRIVVSRRLSFRYLQFDKFKSSFRNNYE